jgi:hypothetical protein
MPSEIIGGAKYSWNPCHSFTEGTACKDVAVIMEYFIYLIKNHSRIVIIYYYIRVNFWIIISLRTASVA